MRKIDSYQYILLGLYVRYLRHVKTLPIRSVRKAISGVVELLEKLDFPVALEGANELKKFEVDLEGISKDDPLPQERKRRLREIMGTLEKMVHAEARTKYLFSVFGNRFNDSYLLEEPENLFAPDVFEGLPEICRYDFTEGFKCLAFGQATAAAFHILRGTEALLKVLYSLKVKKRKRVEIPILSNMVEDLSSKRRESLPDDLLRRLDTIRSTYPNPGTHGEARYEIDQVQDLLGLCIDVVNKMVMEIRGGMVYS